VLKDFDINSIQNLDEALDWIREFRNIVEILNQENRELKNKLQQVLDENNRLKGEQPKPKIKPKKENSNYSSEKERNRPKERNKGSKIDRIETHDSQVCNVDSKLLPADAQFKGYDRVVVQDIKFEAHNILFLKEKYYSPSLRETYLAPLPPGYDGEFGPNLKTLAIKLNFDSNVTQPNLLDLFTDAKIKISAGQLSNFLIKDHEVFHNEKDAIYEAGLLSSPWQHMDDTTTRVGGQNHYCHILCNPLYTAYFTTGNKSRLTVVDVLTNFRKRTFLLNPEAFAYINFFKLPAPLVQQLKSFPQEQNLSQEEFLNLIDKSLPQIGPQQLNHILDAAAIAAYHALIEFPVIRLLICDDAPQFKLVTQQLALCWVHDGRLYKKLDPCVPGNRQLLDSFLDKYWEFYRQLLEYRENPTKKDHVRLDNEFDELFSTQTDYYALDQRIAKTKEKKHSMLLVLDHPEIPLHNNPAELGARKRVRKRVVSFGTRTKDGTNAWDTFNTLSATAKKLGINFYDYISDRISGSYKMPAMAEVITQRGKALQLGASWDTAP
jgi:regulator of replication initiation timing